MNFHEWWYDYRVKNQIGESTVKKEIALAAWLAALDNGKSINQCDGCRRHLPIKNGIHYGDEGYTPVMGCTADRYKKVSEPQTDTK